MSETMDLPLEATRIDIEALTDDELTYNAMNWGDAGYGYASSIRMYGKRATSEELNEAKAELAKIQNLVNMLEDEIDLRKRKGKHEYDHISCMLAAGWIN